MQIQRVSVIKIKPAPYNPRVDLTDRQERIWELLDGHALVAKEIAKRLDCGAWPESVRREIAKMRLRGYRIRTVRGKGYVREDAPPSGSA